MASLLPTSSPAAFTEKVTEALLPPRRCPTNDFLKTRWSVAASKQLFLPLLMLLPLLLLLLLSASSFSRVIRTVTVGSPSLPRSKMTAFTWRREGEALKTTPLGGCFKEEQSDLGSLSPLSPEVSSSWHWVALVFVLRLGRSHLDGVIILLEVGLSFCGLTPDRGVALNSWLDAACDGRNREMVVWILVRLTREPGRRAFRNWNTPWKIDFYIMFYN